MCWVLRKLFTSTQLKDHLVFKGGTSLSKVYHLIDRFSEDIDLVLDWQLLNYGEQEPWEEQASNTRRDRFNKKVNEAAAAYLVETLQPYLVELFADIPGISSAVSADDPMAIDITYPAAFDLDALRPQVKLEIGPLASWVPSEPHVVMPYAAEAYGHVFDDPKCPVVATTAERTFWEKATILHQQAHREKAIAANYSRHYYDVRPPRGEPGEGRGAQRHGAVVRCGGVQAAVLSKRRCAVRAGEAGDVSSDADGGDGESIGSRLPGHAGDDLR